MAPASKGVSKGRAPCLGRAGPPAAMVWWVPESGPAAPCPHPVPQGMLMGRAVELVCDPPVWAQVRVFRALKTPEGWEGTLEGGPALRREPVAAPVPAP